VVSLGLPVEEALPALRRALATGNRAVLQAPPGAGKSTLVPLALLEEPWLAGRTVVMLEPRRLAARAVATRMADLRGEAAGEGVGYRVRFDHRVGARTRIEVVTEAILTRRLQDDPTLEGVGLVIFDEFHERNLHSDLALALCRDAQEGLRDDLRLLVMSATLDGRGLAAELGAALVESAGRSFPVDLRYLPRDPDGPIGPTAAAAVRRALVEVEEGDLLVFLPGGREIRDCAAALDSGLPGGAELHLLYGELPFEAQQRALRPRPGRRKVILATAIAETSLTIEGLRVVVDAGYARVPRFDPRSGLSRLTTVRVSRASADQRAGRAGRLGPGVCYRLWGEATQRGLVPFELPEIETADLAPLALELAAWGVADPAALAWVTPPPAGALAQGRALLGRLEALDPAGRVTAAGRAMARLPFHPRLAHLVQRAEALGWKARGWDVAALLGERDLLRGSGPACNFVDRVDALDAFRARGREAAQRLGADPLACQAVARVAAGGGGGPVQGDVGLLLALAYPDRIARRRGDDPHRYLLANGRGARLGPGCGLAGQEWLAVAELDGSGSEGLVRTAAPVALATLEQHFATAFGEHQDVTWDDALGRPVARRRRTLGAIVLAELPWSDPPPGSFRQALVERVRQLGLEALPWGNEARELLARIESLRRWAPERGLPDCSTEALSAALDSWLGPFLPDRADAMSLARIDLQGALKARLDWPAQQALEEGAPAQIAVPSGHRRRLAYAADGSAPVLAVKLQELFGLADTPRVAWGRVPVILHLLSPAQRPIQVTQDLRGFWERTYPEVKRELKGRYPRHPWPDDPWSAEPTARTKRR
jgi:ATP-dependent helicase HrpB